MFRVFGIVRVANWTNVIACISYWFYYIIIIDLSLYVWSYSHWFMYILIPVLRISFGMSIMKLGWNCIVVQLKHFSNRNHSQPVSLCFDWLIWLFDWFDWLIWLIDLIDQSIVRIITHNNNTFSINSASIHYYIEFAVSCVLWQLINTSFH
jgi:hypothetical protein